MARNWELSLEAAYEMLYGAPPSAAQVARLRGLLPAANIASLHDLRAIIMAHDRQSYPTRAIVRFGPEDLRRISIEGFRLVLDAADLSVSAPILESGVWEPHLTGVFRRYLRPGMRVADIGANVGYYTLLASTLVGPSGEVCAFEPNSENCRLILLSVAENHCQNVRLFPLALSDRIGHVLFSSHIGSNGGLLGPGARLDDGQGMIVPTARLDGLLEPPLDFVKMDVEGAEYRILRGAQTLLATARPIVTTEFSCEMISRVSGIAPRDFLGFFLQHDYEIHMVDRATGRIGAVGDVDTMLSTWGSLVRIEDLLMLPRGIPVRQPD